MLKVSSLRRVLRHGGGFTACLIAVTLLFVNARLADAQALYGSIVGNVTDAQGATVPGVTLTATNTGTALEVETVTDGDGAYTFRNLLPGTYDVKAALTGFREHKETGITVTAGNPVRVNIALAVGTLTETVQVASRHDPAADRQGRSLDAARLEGDHRPAAEPVPELPGADQPGARRDAGAVPERRDRLARPVAAHLGQRHAAEQQRDAHRRRGLGQHLAAAPRRLRPAGRDDRDGQRLDQQLRRRVRHGRRRGDDRDHQVGHQRGARLRVLVRQHRRAERQHATSTTRSTGRRMPLQPQHLRRHRRRAGGAQQAVLLRVVRALRRSARIARQTTACRRRGCATATSARSRPPTPTSVSTTRSPAAPAAPAASCSPNNTIPSSMINAVARRSWTTTRCPTRRADLNSNQILDDYQQFREVRVDRDNYDTQDHLAAQRLALDLGQVLDAGRGSDRQLLARLRRGQPRRHPRLRRRPSATPGR